MGASRNSSARCSVASAFTVPVSVMGISVRTGRASSLMRHWFSAGLHTAKSASVNEKTLFVKPYLKLMRPFVA